MIYPHPLITGRLIKRYKRFLADIELDSGEVITTHCPNTGSMKHCAAAGSRVWLLDADLLGKHQRKYRYSWEWVEVAGRFRACINTTRANTLVAEALRDKRIPELAGDYRIQAEPKVVDGRLDFLLQANDDQQDVYVEVKTVTLLDELTGAVGAGSFPDAVTERGLKHLQRLSALRESGYRAVLLFCVAHEGIDSVSAAVKIDPNYAEMLKHVYAQGVEVLAYRVAFGEQPEVMWLKEPLPVII